MESRYPTYKVMHFAYRWPESPSKNIDIMSSRSSTVNFKVCSL